MAGCCKMFTVMSRVTDTCVLSLLERDLCSEKFAIIFKFSVIVAGFPKIYSSEIFSFHKSAHFGARKELPTEPFCALLGLI